MPGKNNSFSLMRILTWNLVASWLAVELEAAELVSLFLAELAMSVTAPSNLRSLKASTSSRTFCPTVDQDDVHFANIHAGFHFIQVGDGHDFRARHGGGADDAFAEVGS